jgi:hypothetical protein
MYVDVVMYVDIVMYVVDETVSVDINNCRQKKTPNLTLYRHKNGSRRNSKTALDRPRALQSEEALPEAMKEEDLSPPIPASAVSRSSNAEISKHVSDTRFQVMRLEDRITSSAWRGTNGRSETGSLQIASACFRPFSLLNFDLLDEELR